MKRTHGIIIFVLCLTAVLFLGGCGVKHNSPENVVRSLVEYNEKGKTSKIEDCYGIKDDEVDEATKAEIESTIKYFEAMKSKGVGIISCDVIKAYKKYTYMYVYYTVDLGDEKAYPRMETYYVKQQGDDYYIVPPKGISEKMSTAAGTEYAAFMLTDPYKEYQKAYDTFIQKYPSFEEELATKLS